MTAFFHFLLTLLVSFGIAVAILAASFLIFLLVVWVTKMGEKTKRDFGETFCGALMLCLGSGFLWSARSCSPQATGTQHRQSIPPEEQLFFLVGRRLT